MKIVRTLFGILATLGCSLLLSQPAGAQTRHVFAVKTNSTPGFSNGYIYHYTSTDDETWNENIYFTINGNPNKTILVYSQYIASFAGGGQICVAYVTLDSQTQQLRQHVMRSTDNVNWTDTDLTTVNAPLPDTTAGVAGFVDASGHPRLFYITQPISGDEFIAEVKWNGSSWIWEGNLGGTAFAEPGTAVAAYLYNSTPQAFYIGTDGHIHEVFQNSGGSWIFTDVNRAVPSAPLPISGSNLFGLQWSTDAPIHYFTGAPTEGHIVQIFWNNSGWHWNDETQLAGNAPSCIPTRNNGVPAPLTGSIFNNQPTLTCQATTQDIIELRWTGSQEAWGDWTAANGGAPQFEAPIAKYSIGNHNAVFYIDDSAFPSLPVHEYLWDGSANHLIELQKIQYTPVELATAIF